MSHLLVAKNISETQEAKPGYQNVLPFSLPVSALTAAIPAGLLGITV